MLSLDEIREKLDGKSTASIVHATGIHYNTIREIRNNKDANPTYKVIKLLSDYLTNTAYNG